MQTLIEKHWGQGDTERRLERIPSILIRNLKRPHGRTPSPGGSSSLGISAITCSYGYELAQMCDQGLACKSRVDRKIVNRSAMPLRVLAALRRGLASEQVSGILARTPDHGRISYAAIYSAWYSMPIDELRAEVMTSRACSDQY